MREWLDGLLAVLLAPSCAACHSPLDHPTRGCVCATCWNAVETTHTHLCARCGRPIACESDGCHWCGRRHEGVARVRAIGPYNGSLRAIVHALKYDGRRSLAKPLARLMRGAGADLVREAGVAVPVPLHPSRRRERGFNQATDLASHIGLPVVRAIARVRRTPTQTALTAPERAANVRSAFRPTRQARRVRGITVLLVDDVMTTGATLDACAQALREAGAREVFALTAARVESPPR